MKASKRNFAQGGYYENKTDFVLAPQDYAALGAGYDELTMKFLEQQDKAKKDQKAKDQAGIQAFENRTKVMDRLNGMLQGSYDVWADARVTAIADPTAENKARAAEAYSQYSVIKENAVAITSGYQAEVNKLNQGELDATLIGNRAQALIDAQDFNQEIPFEVVNGRIMVPGAEGEMVDWSQSTFFNESVFGQNGRNFIATRKAPGTDFMFEPLSDKYAKEMQGSPEIQKMVADRAKGLDPVAVGGLIEQRLRNSYNASSAAFNDAVAQQYGAVNSGVQNLTVEGMIEAERDFGDPNNSIYSQKYLTDWSMSFDPNQGEIGQFVVSFADPDLSQSVSNGQMSPQTAAAIKNRRDALKYHLENTANSTYFKLKGAVQPTPQGGGGLSFGSGFKKGDRLPEFREVTLYATPGGNVQGLSLDLAVNPVPIRFLGKSGKITNILYAPQSANDKNPRDVVYGFTVESGPIKDAALTNINQEITDIKDLVSELQRDLDNIVDVDERQMVRARIDALRARRGELTADRKNVQKLSEEFTITRDYLSGDNPEAALFRNLGAESGMGDIPVFDEILTSLYSQERPLMDAAQSRFTGASSSQPSPSGGGVGSKYN